MSSERLLKVFIDDYWMEWRRNSANHCAMGRTPFPAFTFTLLQTRHGRRIKYKMGQYAAFPTPTGLWTDYCSLSACQFRATLEWGVPACSAQPCELEPAILFICTHIPSLKIPALHSASFCTFYFIKN